MERQIRAATAVVGAGEAFEDGALPGLQDCGEWRGLSGVRGDEVVFLGGIGAQIEEFAATAFGAVDDEFVAIADDGARAGEILREDFLVVVVFKIACGGAVGAQFHERGRAFLQFGIKVGFGAGMTGDGVVPETDRRGAFRHGAVEERAE